MRRVGLVSILVVACGGSLPTPPSITHPASAYREVPYPPPAALAETVPARPQQDVVWIDGEWVLSGSSFVWRRGGWVVMPRAARFAPWHARYQADGRLMLASGTWYDAQRQPLPAPNPIVEAMTPPNEFTSELDVNR